MIYSELKKISIIVLSHLIRSVQCSLCVGETMKMKRHIIKEMYAKEINAMYAK